MVTTFRLTAQHEAEIVQWFRDGVSMYDIYFRYSNNITTTHIEQVIREALKKGTP